MTATMNIDRLIAELADLAISYTDVFEDAEEPQPVDLSTLIAPQFLADVHATLRDILELPEAVACHRAPIAAACIVLEMARRQAERGEMVIENELAEGDNANGSVEVSADPESDPEDGDDGEVLF